MVTMMTSDLPSPFTSATRRGLIALEMELDSTMEKPPCAVPEQNVHVAWSGLKADGYQEVRLAVVVEVANERISDGVVCSADRNLPGRRELNGLCALNLRDQDSKAQGKRKLANSFHWDTLYVQ